MTPLQVLRALGPGDEPPAEAKQRVREALLRVLVVPTATSPLQSAVAPKGLRGATFGGVGGTKAASLALGIWLFGGVVGAAIYAFGRAPSERVIYVERPHEMPSLTARPAAPSSTPSEPRGD